MADAKTKTSDERRTHGLVSIAVPSDRVTRPVFGRHGFAGGTLVVDWPAIVGSAVASHTLPLGIKFPPKERTEGTLTVKVDSGAFALEMQHLEPLILERINGYFGWKAVARLKLRQGPLPESGKPPAARPAAPSSPPPALDRLAQVEDPELRDVLERLGRRLAQG
ncbi:conserved protein of unknown function(Protein of unknown function DUF721/UPF0232,34-112)) [Magnetospirillum sp. XM-1]|uniref:DUF721 domain-containing protein n=1 Tax=Magnetospirillum sp. XM-1 TaxID=1663591 RepID=UPI00073E09D1|nr:DUF721 domain-containing protein [Magnetospirillum sp. XM-1]CUW38402.1 conserved protein of unknown function(Protein of unknown function DUF721/UPF0232,34-112)) [Magnetospirillum sp. XM-1]